MERDLAVFIQTLMQYLHAIEAKRDKASQKNILTNGLPVNTVFQTERRRLKNSKGFSDDVFVFTRFLEAVVNA